jgi:hypothetical protein
MPSSLFILPQEMEVKASYADALSVCGRTKSGPGSLHVREDFLRLMFGCFGKRRKRFGLTLHRSRADFIEHAIHSHRAKELAFVAVSIIARRSLFVTGCDTSNSCFGRKKVTTAKGVFWSAVTGRANPSDRS